MHFSNGTSREYVAGNSIRLTLAELVSLTNAARLGLRLWLANPNPSPNLTLTRILTLTLTLTLTVTLTLTLTLTLTSVPSAELLLALMKASKASKRTPSFCPRTWLGLGLGLGLG